MTRFDIGGAIGVLNNEIVDATAVIHSLSLETSFAKFLSIWIKATSAGGTPNLKVQWEAGRSRPATEAAADSNFVVPNNMPDVITNLTNEVWNIFGISPPLASFGRLKITGNAANPADTKVWAEIMVQGG